MLAGEKHPHFKSFTLQLYNYYCVDISYYPGSLFELNAQNTSLRDNKIVVEVSFNFAKLTLKYVN